MTRILEIRGDETNVVRKSAERLHILATLKRTGWVLSGQRGAAARLGINRSTLHFRMKKLGITRPLLVNEFNIMGALTDRYMKITVSRDYIAPNSLSSDPLEQKILTCWHLLESMASSNQFVDDGSCQ